MGMLASSKLRTSAAALVALATLAGCGKKDLPPQGSAGSGTGAAKTGGGDLRRGRPRAAAPPSPEDRGSSDRSRERSR